LAASTGMAHSQLAATTAAHTQAVPTAFILGSFSVKSASTVIAGLWARTGRAPARCDHDYNILGIDLFANSLAKRVCLFFALYSGSSQGNIVLEPSSKNIS
jgi:hypothetical protein